MTGEPEVSYLVLSYNYETYIARTIRSILEQTHQDFEIVVVDDASTDRSCEVVESFGDPRIRLIRNALNLGGTASYNRAVTAARGVWLSNLDADDWIAPTKTRVQLDFVRGRPDIAVVGSFVRFVGSDGEPFPDARPHEAEVNVARDLTVLDHWVGRNCLCRSSTLVRRAAHIEIGLDDVSMTRAPDYELWTRFLAHEHGIVVVPQHLTYYRVHSKGVTYGDPIGTFTEMCWILLRNVEPAARARGASRVLDEMYRWVASNSRHFGLGEVARARLLGVFQDDGRPDTYAAFQEMMTLPDSRRETAGRVVLAAIAQVSRSDEVSLRARSLRGGLIERSIGWLRRQASRGGIRGNGRGRL